VPSRDDEHRLRAIFDHADKNGDGVISVRELMVALRHDTQLARLLHLPSHIRQEIGPDGTRAAFERVFAALDEDHKRLISWKQFFDHIMTSQDDGVSMSEPEKQHDADASSGISSATSCVAGADVEAPPGTFTTVVPLGERSVTAQLTQRIAQLEETNASLTRARTMLVSQLAEAVAINEKRSQSPRKRMRENVSLVQEEEAVAPVVVAALHDGNDASLFRSKAKRLHLKLAFAVKLNAKMRDDFAS
jgi:hypothetical protein